MSRILKGNDLEEAIRFMKVAMQEAERSPCKRDQRGVVIVKNDMIISMGYNKPPKGYKCESKYCEPTCKDYAIHAEMNAIINAAKIKNDLNNSRMYHARVENGKLMDSRKPKCYPCSKHILEFGITEFVLKHKEGFTLYEIEEFNRLSLDSIKKK